MYRKVENAPREAEDFELPFEGKLSQDNRWVIMASLVPWEEFEEEYAQNFSPDMGAPALPFRVALGSLIIKEKLGISDRETVEQIKENPYLQYFIGKTHYSSEAAYDPSLLARFRERINVNLVNRINERMVIHPQSENEDEPKKSAETEREHPVLDKALPQVSQLQGFHPHLKSQRAKLGCSQQKSVQKLGQRIEGN